MVSTLKEIWNNYIRNIYFCLLKNTPFYKQFIIFQTITMTSYFHQLFRSIVVPNVSQLYFKKFKKPTKVSNDTSICLTSYLADRLVSFYVNKKSLTLLVSNHCFLMEQVTRIELALAAWKAVVLPLNHTCKWSGKQDSNLRHLGPKPSALPS